MSSKIAVGRMVLYRLTEGDAARVNRRRRTEASLVAAAQHLAAGNLADPPSGNTVYSGERFPMVVTAVFPKEFIHGPGVNGQVFLDGNDSLWVTSIQEGDEPGFWAWPTLV